MEIVGKKMYHYQNNQNKKWNEETFKPLSDLKLSIKLFDGSTIECSTFRMIMDGRVEDHACISTQVGCKYGCKFCTSGKNGFFRNLSSEEMKKELMILCKEKQINRFDCIVFMGIGEPFDNYNEVVGCIKSLLEKNDLYNGMRAISLATVGNPHSIVKFAKEKLPIDLWISLHALIEEKRKKIMPIANKYTVADIIKSAEDYYQETRRFVWINYMLFLGFNNLDEDAEKISSILMGKEDIFKFIITEPNNDIDNFAKATYDDLLKFESKLKKFGVKNEIVRFMTAGKDIGAGCGEFLFTPMNKK